MLLWIGSIRKFFERNIRFVWQETKDLTPVHNRWVRWLLPGLLVKRWLFLSTVGVLTVGLGTMIWLKLTPVFFTVQFVETVLREITRLIPRYVSGPLAILFGVSLIIWGQSRTLGVITEVLLPNSQEASLWDAIANHRKLNRGPKIVVIGGGTGLSTMLRGLKRYSANITAIVTVADDGGSSGRLRREMGGLPPGDIRNCLAALADQEKLVTELFQYRFSSGSGLSGHSFGNLFLSAMNEVTGDWEKAIAACSQVLAVRGEVLPSTLSDVKLWAELSDGRRIEGESNITKARGRIISIGCTPADPPALPRAVAAIKAADYIIMGPGSLYTSIVPNLLVPEIVDAIAATRVPRIYVCNIMTEPGETDDYSVSEHIHAIDRACGRRLFDAVLIQKRSPSPTALERYRKQGAERVIFDRDAVIASGRRIVIANVMHETENGTIRHDPPRLAKVLMRWHSRVY
ncbi:gluconeogenesis factor YvcK family protein [Leptothoe sp. PORK10 BA2]|uniref:gluconeogenesis factor YvcK family protein n=1 Tax=Leptothoe sp. PORK10 BA2 TaxID=3110254 RepID=UPI002B1F879D|nr:gluconeogenesis factor YvcK family protein [Leptothoe sp. PORK10 BA2]MEA5464250.1 gluconeogenesis factor YvcK family protein [Leptothoe sp. PORK10 BA2]